MKKFYTTLIIVFVMTITYSQTFEFSLSYVGVNPNTSNYQVAFMATPSSTVTDGVTADMGAGFYVPSGLTIGNFEIGSSGLPASEWSSQSLGSNGNGDAYFISRVEGGGASVNLNGSGPFQLVLFDIIADPNPNTGGITFVENGDPVFDTLFVQNYMNINLGSGTADAYSQNNPSANSIDFSTLSTKGFNELSIKLYPNPTLGIINIEGDVSKLVSVMVYSILGQNLMTIDANFKQIDVSSLESSVLFIKLNTEYLSKIVKIVKK